MSKKSPENVKPGDYFLTYEKTRNRFVVRQRIVYPDGKCRQPRVSVKRYAHIGRSREAFQAFVDRLNYDMDLKRKREQEVLTAFIPLSVMQDFESALRTEIPNQGNFRYQYFTMFKKYFFEYFVDVLKLPDPKEWIKNQSKWGAALLSKSLNPEDNLFDEKLSAKTIREIIQMANRFMAFLHQQLPFDYPAVKLQPVSKAALKTYAAEMELGRDEPVGKYIKDEDWGKIQAKLPQKWGCFIKLAYYFGLRRAETLGFAGSDDVRPEYLRVRQQLKNFPPNDAPIYAILKGKAKRHIGYWFATPAQAYQWVNEGLYNKMHPKSLSEIWRALMEDLGMTYDLHDLRRTFITKALRHYNARDVQLAAGHVSLATTMKYAQDDRNLEDDGPWKPPKVT